ncbi:UDP-N-acetylmuramate--L-alanine ligase [Candidatus Margulisiibacteriota bacterium]
MINNDFKKIFKLINKNRTIHFIGIGGSGMSAIARILLERGYKVVGSDLKESINTVRLKGFGAKIYYEQSAANLREAGLVVVSTAIKKDNPELLKAKDMGIAILRRAEMLSYLMNKFTKKISIAGTHGKTTTTSMITKILTSAKKEPTYLIGADMNEYNGNAALGKGDYFIAESDESDGSFLCLEPNIGVITNIEAEHMNYYGDLKNLLGHFQAFIDGILMRDGYLVVNIDDPNVLGLIKDIPKEKVVTFSFNKDSNAHIIAKDLGFSTSGSSFTLMHRKGSQELKLRVYGKHNIANALAAIGVAMKENVPLGTICESLAKFSGTRRRFQFMGEVEGIKVFDDYAHHPTEIAATLEGAKKHLKKRIICIFQPHRYTRTINLADEYVHAFKHADIAILTEIYAANEINSKNISAKMIINKMKKKEINNISFIPIKSKIAAELIKDLKKNDVVITMGAGDIHTVAKEIIVRLKQRNLNLVGGAGLEPATPCL